MDRYGDPYGDPYGPLWALMDPYGPVWTLLGTLLGTLMGPYGPLWARMGTLKERAAARHLALDRQGQQKWVKCVCASVLKATLRQQSFTGSVLERTRTFGYT